MHKSNRGLSSKRLVRLLVPLGLLLLGACTSRGTISVVERGNDTMPSPTGCSETLCDYFYERCSDPCQECWDSCGREDDQLSVIKCTQQCSELCAPSAKAAPLAQCATELTACRSTIRNTICA